MFVLFLFSEDSNYLPSITCLISKSINYLLWVKALLFFSFFPYDASTNITFTTAGLFRCISFTYYHINILSLYTVEYSQKDFFTHSKYIIKIENNGNCFNLYSCWYHIYALLFNFLLENIVFICKLYSYFKNLYLLIGLMSREFANGQGDRGSIPDRVIPKDSKNGTWYRLA